jgi:hypothetical protein
LLVFNNSRVIPARLHFQKPTVNGNPGAVIEVSCGARSSQPCAGRSDASPRKRRLAVYDWQQKRWRPGDVLRKNMETAGKSIALSAELINPESNLVQ